MVPQMVYHLKRRKEEGQIWGCRHTIEERSGGCGCPPSRLLAYHTPMPYQVPKPVIPLPNTMPVVPTYVVSSVSCLHVLLPMSSSTCPPPHVLLSMPSSPCPPPSILLGFLMCRSSPNWTTLPQERKSLV